MGLDAVLSAVRDNVVQALITAGLTVDPAQVFKGWPTATQLVEVLGQPGGKQYQISVYPLPGQNVTRWLDDPMIYQAPDVQLTAAVAGSALTLGGTVVTGNTYNIHAFMRGINADVFAQALDTDTPATAAVKVANAVNALAIAGVSAAATLATINLTGAEWERCNVGGTGLLAQETMRIGRKVQVTVWTTNASVTQDESLRLTITDAILASVGTKANHFVTCSDGTVAYVMYAGDSYDDDSQSSYSLYSAALVFDVEYSQLAITDATQIGVVIPTTTETSPAGLTQTKTQYIGGP